MRPITDLYILASGFVAGSVLLFSTSYFLPFIASVLPVLLATTVGIIKLGSDCTRADFENSIWATTRVISTGIGIFGGAVLAKLL